MSLMSLRNRAIEVRNETNYKANTASRIGQILIDVIDYVITLVTDSHTHTNKTVLDDLNDTGSKLTYKGQVIETTSEISVSTWIDPPVIKKVTSLPVSPIDGDRYILTTDNRIYEYVTDIWVVDVATDPVPTEGSAVVVRYNTADELINAIHLFELGEWVDKSADFTFDESRFITAWDETNGRRLIPITGSPNTITETGFYYGSDNVVGSPLYDGGERSTSIVYYVSKNHNNDNAHQSAISLGTELIKWERRKISGVWESWVEEKNIGGQVLLLKSPVLTVWALTDYRDGWIKTSKSEYYNETSIYYEQRFDWNEDSSVKRIEIKDEILSLWIQRNYTWTNNIPTVTETTITAWTI